MANNDTCFGVWNNVFFNIHFPRQFVAIGYIIRWYLPKQNLALTMSFSRSYFDLIWQTTFQLLDITNNTFTLDTE